MLHDEPVASYLTQQVDLTPEQLGAVHEALRFLLRDDRLKGEMVPLHQAYLRIRRAAGEGMCSGCGERWARRRGLCDRCYMRQRRERMRATDHP